MLGDPETALSVDPERAPRLKLASYASSRFITGAVAGLIAQRLLGFTSSDLGGLMIATLGAAFVAEGLDMLFASRHSPDPRTQHRCSGCCETLSPLFSRRSRCTRPPLRSSPRVHGVLALDGAALLHSRACCPATLRHVPAAATARRGFEASEHVVRRGSRRDAREERPVHSGTLKGRRHLLARYRRADGAFSGRCRSGRTSAVWFTTSARSGCPRACC